jgi:hypothetical protein
VADRTCHWTQSSAIPTSAAGGIEANRPNVETIKGRAGVGRDVALSTQMALQSLPTDAPASSALRDADMRARLEVWIRSQHGDTPTAILHELKIPRPSARVDVAVINGELSAFEIKSDVDSLWRLPRQVRSFDCVFDRVSLVTTEKHLRRARAMVPRWWGIFTLSSETVDIRQRRQARVNPRRRVLNLLHMLSRPELLSLATREELHKGCSGLARQAIIERLTCVPEARLRGHARELLAARQSRVAYSSPPSSSVSSPPPPGSESCAAE